MGTLNRMAALVVAGIATLAGASAMPSPLADSHRRHYPTVHPRNRRPTHAHDPLYRDKRKARNKAAKKSRAKNRSRRDG